MANLEALARAVVSGNAAEVQGLIEAALGEGLHPGTVVNEGLIAGMDEIGRRFKENEIFVPEVMLAAKAMQSGLAVLRPLMAEKKVEPLATVILGTVKGDQHDIGKNLVGMMLEGAGFSVVDLGVNVAPERFIGAAEERGASLIGLSALLTTTMPVMEATIRGLQAAGLRDRIKVMIGGAPVSQEYADRIGADGYAEDAAAAVDLARKLCGL